VSGAVNDYTPFGYLRNPSHHAVSWAQTAGGNLRMSPDRVGAEWVYPVGRDPRSRVGLAIEFDVDGQRFVRRSDFARGQLRSRHHTCLIAGYDWAASNVEAEARCFLADDDALAVRVTVRNASAAPREVQLRIVQYVEGGRPPEAHELVGATSLAAQLAPGESGELRGVLGRAGTPEAAHDHAAAARPRAATVYQWLLDEDDAFALRSPTLTGDWPPHWPEGLHHDLQTTRALVQPAGGRFADIWPSWMVAWPRVVFAEGILDMLRLAYADQQLAQRAILSLLRDAPMANVPCIFRDGEYNMVAADGSRCGTSPSWCLPFLNLQLLYLRSLDREWLGRIYPYLGAYVRWWLVERTDADGWLVYRCTWESGEDGNPRLDPTESGDGDISDRVRPVELQATMAHAAGVLAFFAAELGEPVDEWLTLEADCKRRTRQLFDAREGRYRDWMKFEGHLATPCPERSYWGIDPCRGSAQSLTPLLIGEPLIEDEVWRYAAPPWTSWPSWTWSLVESAAAAGHFAQIGAVCWPLIDRVYRVTTRRDLDELQRPMPGSAPEFWPEDWSTYQGNDGYGWGATTTNLLIRHLVGFKESLQTDGWCAELTPALPPQHLVPGTRFGIQRLSYRGLRFDLTYLVEANGLWAEIDLGDAPRTCLIQLLGCSRSGPPRSASTRRPPGRAVSERLEDSSASIAQPGVPCTCGSESASVHRFAITVGQRYQVRLS
jgi:hypothetical protein